MLTKHGVVEILEHPMTEQTSHTVASKHAVNSKPRLAFQPIAQQLTAMQAQIVRCIGRQNASFRRVVASFAMITCLLPSFMAL